MMQTSALVFPYPSEGQLPAFVVRDPHVFDYADQNKVSYWIHEGFWYDYPDGKEPAFFRKDDYLYDYWVPGRPRYLIRQGALVPAQKD
jgi:hypothetical protein